MSPATTTTRRLSAEVTSGVGSTIQFLCLEHGIGHVDIDWHDSHSATVSALRDAWQRIRDTAAGYVDDPASPPSVQSYAGNVVDAADQVLGRLVPVLPAVGDKVSLFGLDLTVTVVEPAADWFWSIEAVNERGETATFTVPTDERTV